MLGFGGLFAGNKLGIDGEKGSKNAPVTGCASTDTQAPVANCQDVTVYLDAAGSVTVQASDLDNGSTDNCGIAAFAIDNEPTLTYTCDSPSVNTVSFVARDSANLIGFCSSNPSITVLDTMAPTAICQDVTVYIDNAGMASTFASDVNNGSTDNCGITSISLSDSLFDCTLVDTATVTLTLQDSSGNTSSCTAQVVGLDTISPVAICQNLTVELGVDKTDTIEVGQLNNSSTDNCGIETVTASQTIFTCADEGNNQSVVLTVTDSSGNVATCTSSVDVNDLFNGSSTNCGTVAVDIYLDSTGTNTILASDLAAFLDGCHVNSYTITPATVNCSQVGAGILGVSVSYTTSSNPSGFCAYQVTVLDTIPPVAVCKDLTLQLDASGQANITAADLDSASTDNCSNLSFTASDTAFDCSQLGSVLDTLYVSDGSNSDSCTATITIQDSIAPIALCQDITLQLDSAGLATLSPDSLDNGSSDNCTDLIFSADSTDFDCSEVGSNTVLLTVADSSGNTDTCSATVDIEDNIAPVAVCRDATVYLDAAGSATINASALDSSSVDACGILYSPAQFTYTCADTGVSSETIILVDPNSNSNTCTVDITIVDSLAPVVTCRTDTFVLVLDSMGLATLVADSLEASSSDNCDTPTLSVADPSLDCSVLGFNTVFLVGSDSHNNQDSCSAVIEVRDTIAPEAFCNADTVYFDSSGIAPVLINGINNGSNDICGVPVLFSTPDTLTCADSVATVVLTVADASGNQDTCSSSVTVLDTIAPVAVCHPVTVSLDPSGSLVVPDSIIDSLSFDNCGFTYSLGTDTLFCSDLGANAVTLTITDPSGNSATCTDTVHLEDAGAASASCRNITVYLNSSGYVTIIPSDLDDGSVSVCGISSSSISVDSFVCADIGTPVTVELTVTDQSNNTSSCTGVVTVEDTLPPVPVCENTVSVALNASGFALLTPAAHSGFINDNCSGTNVTFALDRDTVDCSDLGTTTRTLYIADTTGNTDSCTTTLTVTDPIAPNAICQGDSVYLDTAGIAQVDPAALNANSTDNCVVDSLATDQVTLDCQQLGANTITLYTYDAAGNLDSCTATVTVFDTLALTTICTDTTLYLAANGTVALPPAAIDNGSFDNCALQSSVTSPSSVNCSVVDSTITATLTLTDSSGNSSSCTSQVTILDTIAPTAVCQDITVYLPQAATVSILATDVDGGTTDNCTVVSLVADTTTFHCADIGPNTVNLTATDQSGKTHTCTATVTVLDTVSPIPLCQDITVHLDTAGQTSFVTADIENGSTDNCKLDTVFLNTYAFTCAQLGANTINLTAVDSSGNSRSCAATVTVLDTISPKAVCDSGNVYLNASGSFTYTAAHADAGSSDNCSIDNFTFATQSFDCSQLEQSFVLPLVATDLSGNTSTCNATITIKDSTPPSLICQNITVYLDSAFGQGAITVNDIDRGSIDNCTLDTLFLDTYSFECSSVGANSVVMTGIDQSGVTATCTSTVTVLDTVSPLATCVDVTVYLSDSGTTAITTSMVSQATSDNCGIDSILLSKTVFDCSDIGTQPVLLEVLDPSLNNITCSTNITVLDTTPPATLCDTIFAAIGTSGQVTVTINDIDIGTTDNCGIDTLMFSSATYFCADVAQTFQMPLTALDVNGNSKTCIGLVTVADSFPPVVACQNRSYFLDTTGILPLVPADLGSATDNCTFTEEISIDTLSCGNIGTNTITYTATDQFGQASFCTSTVTVFDTIVPEIDCGLDTVFLDSAGFASISPRDIVSFIGDGCGNVALVATDSTFDCSNVGLDSISIFAVDNGQNISACLAYIDVNDTIFPVAVCQSDTAYLDANGTVTPLPSSLDGGSTDNCTISTWSLSTPTFTCNEIGVNAVTMSVMDVDSNVSSCQTTITILDTVSPVAICQNQIITLNSNGVINLSFADVDGGSYDSCGIASINLSSTFFTCSQVGVQNITLTVTDLSGNAGTCTSLVTVVDSVSPVAVCQPFSVLLDSAGQATISPANVDGGSSDNCNLNSAVLSDSVFACGDAGNVQVLLTVFDDYFNEDTCSATVTIIDSEAPVAECVSDTLYLDTLGSASIGINNVDNGSSDNCGIASISLSDSTFDCSQTGLNPLVLTVEDQFGNIDTCQANALVLDTLAPVALCQNITLSLDATGSASLTVNDVDAGSSDNCALVNSVVDTTTFLCGDVGTNVVQLTVFDPSGNSSSCTADVTVEDNTAPTAVCQDLTLFLDAAGTASTTTAAIDNGSADNCGLDTTYIDVTDFTCVDVGVSTVTLTATDVNGLSSTCMASVEVLDTISPTVSCMPDSIYLDSMGLGSITVADIEASSGDNCGLQSVVLSQTTFSQADVGQNTVTLTATDLNGNVSDCQTTVTVLDTIVGLVDAELWMGQLDIWPNPTQGRFQVQLTGADKLLGEEVSVELTDLRGKVLLRGEKKYMSGGLQWTFDLGAYANGVYILRLTAKGRSLTEKMIKN